MAAMFGSGDDGLADLTVLKSATATPSERGHAFRRLLERDGGWWGSGPLGRFCERVATRFAQRKMQESGISIDAEGLAADALILLFERAASINSHPRGWLIVTIKNKILEANRQGMRDRQTARLLPLLSSLEPLPDAVAKHAELYDAVRAKLSRSLRVILDLFVEGFDEREIPIMLGLTPAAWRQRRLRLRKYLLDEIKARHGPARARALAREYQRPLRRLRDA